MLGLSLAAAPHVIVDQVTKALSVSDSGWGIFAAFAAASAAIGTLILAWMTRNLASATNAMAVATQKMGVKTEASVRATEAILANQADSFRKGQTITLMDQYFQVPIRLADISLTPYSAHNDMVCFVRRLDEVKQMKALHDKRLSGQSPTTQVEAKLLAQRDSLFQSIPITLNFYQLASYEFFEGVLDENMFLKCFADPFLSALEMIKVLNPILEPVPEESLKELDSFRAKCEEWQEKERVT